MRARRELDEKLDLKPGGGGDPEEEAIDDCDQQAEACDPAAVDLTVEKRYGRSLMEMPVGARREASRGRLSDRVTT